MDIYSVPAPWTDMFLLFIVFRLDGESFWCYLWCSGSLERDFVAIYGVPSRLIYCNRMEGVVLEAYTSAFMSSL